MNMLSQMLERLPPSSPARTAIEQLLLTQMGGLANGEAQGQAATTVPTAPLQGPPKKIKVRNGKVVSE